jgi:hypothetical protein
MPPRTRLDRSIVRCVRRCLGPGHQLNHSYPGLCRGRWQWYQLQTVHTQPVTRYGVGPSGEWERLTEQKTLRHAVAFELQTEYCPHTADCGAIDAEPEYYTTVDVLVVRKKSVGSEARCRSQS